MTDTWIISANKNIAALVDLGREYGGKVNVIVAGDVDIAGVDRVIRIPIEKDAPVEVAAPVFGNVLAGLANRGDMILAANRPAERVLAAAAAARLGAPIFTGLRHAQPDGDLATGHLARFGGIADQDVAFRGPYVAVVDGGGEIEGEAVESEDASHNTAAADTYSARIVSEEKDNVQSAQLNQAQRIVCAGRGFNNKEDLSLAEDLAKAVDGELGCTRPLSEGTSWMSRDRYIGISGVSVSPDLYIAAGVSGQIQHTSGINDAKVIVAINNDPDAPIFEQADYGIVGDVYQIIPALTQALQS
ncbi:MAG: electron transfer flavoprotein subunit alpha/FixB family protein [Actinomycetaceae bacterium]|nr:electron transfer flavoprotein subunit alpha/FixB family protein [Actinomycetaceae bacterium]